MKATNKDKFEAISFGERLKSMLSVDFCRMFISPIFYIMIGTSLIIPILVFVMTTMMAGTTTINQQTGVETTIEAFENTWQAIGSLSNTDSAMSMDLTSMCNINLIYFLAAVFVCIFVSDDFKSGYSKNLFTVRGKKTDYIISKTLICFVCGACMILTFFIGAMLGGAISGLSFDIGAASAGGIVMCLLSKIILMAVFVPIYLVMSIVAKQKTWLSILLSLMVGMFLFMMIPMLTPLDATIINVVLCLAGGGMFSFGLGAVGNAILRKKDLI